MQPKSFLKQKFQQWLKSSNLSTSIIGGTERATNMAADTGLQQTIILVSRWLLKEKENFISRSLH